MHSTADLLYRTEAGNTFIPDFSSFLIFLSSASSSSAPFSFTQVEFFWNARLRDTTAPSFNISKHSCLWGAMGIFTALTNTLVDNTGWIKQTQTDDACVYWFLFRCMMGLSHIAARSGISSHNLRNQTNQTLAVYHSGFDYLRGLSPPTGDVELLRLILSSSLSLLLFLRGAGR